MEQEIIGYINVLFSVVAVSSLVLFIVNGGQFYSALKSLCSLALILAIIGVLDPFLSSVVDISFQTTDKAPVTENGIIEESYVTECGRYIKDYTHEYISTKFDIDKHDFKVGVTLETNGSEVKLKTVTVIFEHPPEIPSAIISSQVENLLMCECIILLPGETEK